MDMKPTCVPSPILKLSGYLGTELMRCRCIHSGRTTHIVEKLTRGTSGSLNDTNFVHGHNPYVIAHTAHVQKKKKQRTIWCPKFQSPLYTSFGQKMTVLR